MRHSDKFHLFFIYLVVGLLSQCMPKTNDDEILNEQQVLKIAKENGIVLNVQKGKNTSMTRKELKEFIEEIKYFESEKKRFVTEQQSAHQKYQRQLAKAHSINDTFAATEAFKMEIKKIKPIRVKEGKQNSLNEAK